MSMICNRVGLGSPMGRVLRHHEEAPGEKMGEPHDLSYLEGYLEGLQQGTSGASGSNQSQYIGSSRCCTVAAILLAGGLGFAVAVGAKLLHLIK